MQLLCLHPSATSPRENIALLQDLQCTAPLLPLLVRVWNKLPHGPAWIHVPLASHLWGYSSAVPRNPYLGFGWHCCNENISDKVIALPPKCPRFNSLLFLVYPQSVGNWVASLSLFPALLYVMKHVLSHLQRDCGGLPWISVHLRLVTLSLVVLGLAFFSCDPALMTHLLIY